MAYGFAQGDTSYTSGWTCQLLVTSPGNVNLGYDVKDPHGFNVVDHPNGGNLGTQPDKLKAGKPNKGTGLTPPMSQLQRENAIVSNIQVEANPEGTQPSEQGTFPGSVEAPAEGVVHEGNVQVVEQLATGEEDGGRAWNGKPGHEGENPNMEEHSPGNEGK